MSLSLHGDSPASWFHRRPTRRRGPLLSRDRCAPRHGCMAAPPAGLLLALGFRHLRRRPVTTATISARARPRSRRCLGPSLRRTTAAARRGLAMVATPASPLAGYRLVLPLPRRRPVVGTLKPELGRRQPSSALEHASLAHPRKASARGALSRATNVSFGVVSRRSARSQRRGPTAWSASARAHDPAPSGRVRCSTARSALSRVPPLSAPARRLTPMARRSRTAPLGRRARVGVQLAALFSVRRLRRRSGRQLVCVLRLYERFASPLTAAAALLLLGQGC